MSKFIRMRSLIGGGSVEKVTVKKHLIKGVLPTYKSCVAALKRVIDAEKNDEKLLTGTLDTSQWISKKGVEDSHISR